MVNSTKLSPWQQPGMVSGWCGEGTPPQGLGGGGGLVGIEKSNCGKAKKDLTKTPAKETGGG